MLILVCLVHVMEVGLFVAVVCSTLWKRRGEKRGRERRGEKKGQPSQTKPATSRPAKRKGREGKGGTGEKVGRCGEDR